MFDQIFETNLTDDERDAIEDAPYMWTVSGADEKLETIFAMLEQDFYGFFAVEDGEGFIFGYEDMTIELYETMELLGIAYYRDDRSLEAEEVA